MINVIIRSGKKPTTFKDLDIGEFFTHFGFEDYVLCKFAEDDTDEVNVIGFIGKTSLGETFVFGGDDEVERQSDITITVGVSK